MLFRCMACMDQLKGGGSVSSFWLRYLVQRLQTPRLMGCYRNLLQFVLLEQGRQALIAEYPDLSLLLEYGVAQQTQISLITAGLSRTSTIALSELIASDSLSQAAVKKWLTDNARLWRESALSQFENERSSDCCRRRQRDDVLGLRMHED
jgi:hypothetical protein